MSRKSSFDCTLNLSANLQETILQYEIDSIIKIENVNERIGSAVKLFLNKIENIMVEDSTPDVIICGIPFEIEEYCGISEMTRGAKSPKPTKLEKEIVRLKKCNQQFLSDWGCIVDEEKEKK
jgi:methyl coenzyme M reductase subunit C